jgi:hypothetical protein
LLTGLVRCGRCGRMMRVFYGMRSGHAHRYQCRRDVQGEYQGMCVGVGGVRVDRAVAAQILGYWGNLVAGLGRKEKGLLEGVGNPHQVLVADRTVRKIAWS